MNSESNGGCGAESFGSARSPVPPTPRSKRTARDVWDDWFWALTPYHLARMTMYLCRIPLIYWELRKIPRPEEHPDTPPEARLP